MKRFKYWIESVDPFQIAKELEPSILNNPIVQDEINKTGTVKLSTLDKIMGPNLQIGSSLMHHYMTKNGRFDDRKYQAYQKSLEAPTTDLHTFDFRITHDDYFYHVTLKQNIKDIRKNGLSASASPLMSNYSNYSKGKIFFCDLNGINYWKERVGDHYFHNTGKDAKLAVVRVKKAFVQNVQADKVGEQDSKMPAYFTNAVIPASLIELV